MDEKKKTIKYNFIMNLIIIITQMIYPLLSFMYIARILTTVGVGKVNFAISIVSYFVLIASLGIPVYGMREIARNRENKKKVTEIFFELFFINVIMMLIAYLVFIVVVAVTPRFRNESYLFFIISAQILLSVLNISWFYQGMEEFEKVAKRNVFIKLLSFLLLFLFVKKGDDYLEYSIIYVFAEYGTAFLNLFGLKDFFKWREMPKKINYKKHIKATFTFFSLSMAATFFGNLDKTMIGFISGDEQVAIYTTGFKAIYILYPLIVSLGGVIIPRISFYIQNNNYEKALNLISKNIIFVLITGVPCVLYFYYFSEPIINIFVGEAYKESVLIMKLVVIYPILTGLWDIFQNQVMIPLGKEKQAVIITLIGIAVNGILNIPLIFRYGAAGAATSLICSEVIILILYLIILKNYSKFSITFNLLFRYIIIFSSIWIILKMISKCNFRNDLVTLTVAGILLIACYFILLSIFKVPIFMEAQDYIIKQINKKRKTRK